MHRVVRLGKVCHKQVLTCLSSRYGVGLCLAGVVLTLISAFQFGEVFIQWSKQKYAAQFSIFTDNVAATSFQERLCSPVPIDVVYTWVNGSDPILQRDLAELKYQMELEANRTAEAERTRKALERLRKEAQAVNASFHASSTSAIIKTSTPTPKTSTRPSTTPSANHTAPIQTTLPPITKLRSPLDDTLVFGNLMNSNLPLGGRTSAVQNAIAAACGPIVDLQLDALEVGGIVTFLSPESVQHCLHKSVDIHSANVTFRPAWHVGNHTFDGLHKLPLQFGLGPKLGYGVAAYKGAMLANIPPSLPSSLLQTELKRFGNVSRFTRSPGSDLAVINFAFRWPLIEALDAKVLRFHRSPEDNAWKIGHLPVPTQATKTNQTDQEAHPNAKFNYLVDIVAMIKVGEVPGITDAILADLVSGRAHGGHKDGEEELDEKHEGDELAASRFQDNSELQYSLRAIEKNAPWVRHIYIVTNGQIPSWLDLDHPRITLVTHDELFTNKSHLPTFSSPAIEAHLHRIPGLSKKFVYLNDDVLFGTQVWPDDFFTQAKGQKIYQAWPVPNCDEGCPSNWIGDNYCDLACNSSQCDWDGGDCLGKDSKVGGQANQWNGGGGVQAVLPYCSQGCADSWMGDRYCDRACNVAECGFDTGDCGLEPILEGSVELQLFPSDRYLSQAALFVKDKPPRSVYLNLTKTFGTNFTITEATHDNAEAIAAAVVNQPAKFMFLVFRENLNRTDAKITLAAKIPGQRNDTVLSFDLEIQTLQTVISPPSADKTGNVSLAANLTNAKIVNASTINHWQIPKDRTTPRPKSKTYFVPPVNTSSLPLEVQQKLQDLQADLDAGDLTKKGFAKYQYQLLLPFFNSSLPHLWLPQTTVAAKRNQTQAIPAAGNKTAADSEAESRAGKEKQEKQQAEQKDSVPEARRRRLLSWPVEGKRQMQVDTKDSETSSHHTRAAPPLHKIVKHSSHPPPTLSPQGQVVVHDQDTAPPLGGYVWRNGVRVRLEDLELSDWIANMKEKQLRLKDDLSRSVKEWEDKTGRRWHYQPDRELEMTKYKGFLPWEQTGELDIEQ
eukprot:m.194338 g.194338  ORF g.194338 m.194338 type:complete len:1063 (-) comp25794_c0_seq7:1091-4279(-)